MDKINIGQWNCRSAISNKINLENLLFKEKIHLIRNLV